MLSNFTCIKKQKQQKGIASLLAILFIGFAMAALVVGIASSVKNSQDASVAALGQTHAQILSAAGAQALGASLSESGKSSSEIAEIVSGNIEIADIDPDSSISYVASMDCPVNPDPLKNNFCFDITGQSKGSISTVRAIYESDEVSDSGSVFAGGLLIDGNAKFINPNPTSKVSLKIGGAGYIVNNKGERKDYEGFMVEKYKEQKFVSAEDLRKDSNYIFEYVGNKIVCYKNNLNDIVDETSCNPSDSDGVKYEKVKGTNKWVIDSSKLWPGVYWFKGDVHIETKENTVLVNTIIATGKLTITQPNGSDGTFLSFSPAFYLSFADVADVTPKDQPDYSQRLERVCGSVADRLPSQYCLKNEDENGDDVDFSAQAGAVGQILFLAGSSLELDTQPKTKNFYYGNVMATSASGGTGSASAKFTGTGELNIIGKIIVSGTAEATEMLGNITIKLSNPYSSTAPNTQIFILQGIKYL